MNIKELCIVLCFSAFGFIPKAVGQSHIIIDKDTFGVNKKFITPDHKITSKWDKMGHANCISSNGGFPIWRIENDSLFLIKIVNSYISTSDEREEYTEVLADLSKEFGKRYVNGRVFAKEISDMIMAFQIIDTFATDTAMFYTETIAFLTIKKGKLTQHIEFTGTTQWSILRHGYQSNKLIAQRGNWQTQPEMPLNGGTKVVVKIAVDDKEKVTKAQIIEGSNKRWNKSIIKAIKFLNLMPCNHFAYRNYDNPKVIYKKDKVVFIVKKPH